ncbi:MAG: thiol reductant ABC exporter subunit CydD [Peptococcaceae bacterium]|nr:thiol reductant ABC exporter subunit CydD [Peptococcaceae bacterium]
MLDKKLLREARQTKFFLSLTIGLGIASGLLTILQAGCFARIISGVLLEDRGLSDVQGWMALLLLVIFLRALLALFSESSAQRTAARIKEDLRQRLLSRLFFMGPVQVRGERTGELVNVLVEGVEALETYFAKYVPQLALAALVPLSILGFIYPLDLLSGAILLITAPLIPFLMILIGKWATVLSRKQWEALSRMSAHFLDVLQGLTTLKLFGRSKTQLDVIARVSDRFRETTLGVLRIAFLSALVLELLSTLSTALVAVALGLRLVYGQILFEQAFFILVLAPEFYLPLRLLGTQFHAGMAGVSAAGRIFEILETPLDNIPGEERGSMLKRAESCSSAAPHISLENITVRYEKEQVPVLNGISLELLPGERVAVVGSSGAGKSTLAAVLLRLLEPEGGQIRVNGIPWQELDPEEWRSGLAYVPQHPHLFYGTVVDNIRLSSPGASEHDVITAARLAGAHEFICGLSQGYDTLVGEGGTNLSGGQIQRLALARAFLRKASFLILDEATSSLDPERESLVQDSLERLSDCTVLIIAHRLALAERADRILVMENGQVTEAGTHEELLFKKGDYYRLVEAYGGAG